MSKAIGHLIFQDLFVFQVPKSNIFHLICQVIEFLCICWYGCICICITSQGHCNTVSVPSSNPFISNWMSLFPGISSRVAKQYSKSTLLVDCLSRFLLIWLCQVPARAFQFCFVTK